MIKRTGKLIKSLLIGGSLVAGVAANATVLTLPDANYLTVGVYNSFSVYSLDLLAQCASNPLCQPQSGIPVASSPGQIADQAIVLTSAGGNAAAGNVSNFTSPFPNGSAVDDPFMTPSGQQGGSFEMTAANEPGSNVNGQATFTGDQTARWDIKLSLLDQYLGAHDLVFLFDNNQEGNTTGQFLQLWAQARIVDANGNIVGGQCYEVSLLSGGCGDTSANPNPPLAEYLPVVGNFCVKKSDGSSYKIGTAQNQGDCDAGDYFVTNNLSTSVAEFAAFNQSLQDFVKNDANGNYYLSINVKYFNDDGGYEQLWICGECDIGRRRVPEPGSMALAALALLGLAGVAKYRSSRQH